MEPELISGLPYGQESKCLSLFHHLSRVCTARIWSQEADTRTLIGDGAVLTAKPATISRLCLCYCVYRLYVCLCVSVCVYPLLFSMLMTHLSIVFKVNLPLF